MQEAPSDFLKLAANLRSVSENVSLPSASDKVDLLSEWYSGKIQFYERNVKHLDFSGTFVSLLVTILQNPDEELLKLILARENGRLILISAFEKLVPKIYYLAKKSDNPGNYSGPFPGPLMAMSRDRGLANFIKTWEIAAKSFYLEDILKIIEDENIRLLQINTQPKARKVRVNKTAPLNQNTAMNSENSPVKHLGDLNGVRPYDVFNVSGVRRKFKRIVGSIISSHSSAGRTIFRGSMGNVRQGYEWDIFGGIATETPSLWGRPSSLIVSSEEARAKILILMGVSLHGSKTYSRYKIID